MGKGPDLFDRKNLLDLSFYALYIKSMSNENRHKKTSEFSVKNYNVTYYSNWEKPRVFTNVSEEVKNELVQEGKEDQYKVEVEEVGFWDAVEETSYSPF